MVTWKDLRGWLKEVEKIGELARIKEEVDWDEELTAVTYLTGKKIRECEGLFEGVQGLE
jgi:3-polyprenyl-4-hydroxybenzoate decarboxylase